MSGRIIVETLEVVSATQHDSGFSVDNCIAEERKKALARISAAWVVENHTNYNLTDCVAVVGYRSGGGATRAGFSIAPRTIKTVMFEEAGKCIYQTNGLLFYTKDGVKSDIPLSTKTAPEGKCFTKVTWKVVYQAGVVTLVESDEFRE